METYSERVKTHKIKENPIILAIESSCDETACAVLEGRTNLLSSEIESSMTEHIRFGGVVPEIASRAHTTAISIVVERALKNSGKTLADIDAVAVTYGAGLLGALLVGVSYAKALAFALGVPLVPVSHIRGHLAAIYLADPSLKPPFISLLASGGHTAIIEVKQFGEYEVIGETLDDAAGEAFDKVARVLGLEYPGGPNIERLAREGKTVVELPAMLKGKDCYDFSYSGLKTVVINYVHNHEQSGAEYSKADVACSFQHAAVDVLVKKAIKAAKERGLKVITAGGGVVANGYLRDTLSRECADNGLIAVLPPKKMCTDNAAMIAAEGYLRYRAGDFADMTLNAKARVDLA